MTRDEAIHLVVESTIDSLRRTLTNYLKSQDPETYSLERDVDTVKEHGRVGIDRALSEGFNDEPPWPLDDPRWDPTQEAFEFLSK